MCANEGHSDKAVCGRAQPEGKRVLIATATVGGAVATEERVSQGPAEGSVGWRGGLGEGRGEGWEERGGEREGRGRGGEYNKYTSGKQTDLHTSATLKGPRSRSRESAYVFRIYTNLLMRCILKTGLSIQD